MAAMTTPDAYPVRLDVDYPSAPRNRLTVFFRLLTVIPILFILMALSGGITTGADDTPFDGGRFERFDGDRDGAGQAARTTVSSGGIVVLPTVLMLLFRRKYPRWWFDWNRELCRFGNRVTSYLFLLRDEYPSTDEEQAVHLEIDYPDAQQLNRWLPLVKWLLAFPHYIVLAFLALAVLVVTFVAWLAILVTGGYPRGLFDFVVGSMRWGVRVSGYAFLLVTDRYPPFSLR